MTLRNNLASGTITGLALSIDGRVMLSQDIRVVLDGREINVVDISEHDPLSFGLNSEIVVQVAGPAPGPGTHSIEVRPVTQELGTISIQVQDSV